MAGRMLSPALTCTGRSLGAFWANIWAAHELEGECLRLSSVLDHSDVAIMALDPQGRVAVWNSAMAQLTGLPAEDAVQRPVRDLFGLADEDGTPVTLVAGLHRSVRMTTSTERSLWVDVSSSLLADRPTLLTAVFVDVSARRQLDGVRNLVLSSIHHELQTPLTMIHGHARLLETSLPEGPAERSLGAIVDAVEMMSRTIGDLVRLDADPLAAPSAAPEDVDVAPLLRRAVASVPSVASRADVSAESGLSVHADPVRLRECVLLILNNAEKYAPRGRITITARRDGTSGVIDVADQGPGIPAGERDLVLQPYHRLPATRDLPGSGLGLHIAQMMLSAMRGRLALSDAPSGGLMVSLSLPLVPGQAPGQAEGSPG
jgi:PAS domain S-box-containing protein